MAHKTFCVCQEPDQDKILITSVIKDLTSGAISHGRKINKAETMFKNNALIVMESNRVLQYDTVDDAVKRRMIVYEHKSKFTTEVNDAQLKNVKYKFSANQDVINRAKTHTEYWDALFQILLEHATDLLNRGIKVVSDIKKPRSIEQFTQYSFENSSALLRYLYDNYEEDSESFIFVTDLVQQIRDYDKTLRDNDEDPILSNSRGAQMKILQELQNKYSGKFYKLKPEFVKKRNFRRIFDNETDGKNINEMTEMSIRQLQEFLKILELTQSQKIIADMILKEIAARLQFLLDVGLEYLTLSRAAGTLSGGEAQRIRLATQIGSGLTGVLYILDEPSIRTSSKR